MLDEPTAALGVAQTAQVLDLITRLRERGLGVVLISHNLADVFEVADRIVVLRLGRRVATFKTERDDASEEVVGAITGATRMSTTARRRAPDEPPRRPSRRTRRAGRRRAADAEEPARSAARPAGARIAQLGSLRVAIVLALIWIIFQSPERQLPQRRSTSPTWCCRSPPSG